MKIISLKVIHRILVKGMIDSFGKSGKNLSELNKLIKLLDVFEFTQTELKDLNLRVEDGMLKWNAKVEDQDIDVEEEFEVSDEQFELLKSIVKEKDEKKEFSLAEATPFMYIANQLEYEVK